MAEKSELSRIIREESSESFDSFTDIDSISDTTILAITFLLSAQVTLSTVVVTSAVLSSTVLRELFIGMGILTIFLIFLSLNSIIKSLLPVGFYSENVGKPLLDYRWIPVGNSRPEQFSFLHPQSSETDHSRIEAVLRNLRVYVRNFYGRPRTEEITTDHQSVRRAAERFVDEYSGIDEVDSYDMYQMAKLQHYKEVGLRKAQYTGIGLAWLRLSVVIFILQFTVLFVGVMMT